MSRPVVLLGAGFSAQFGVPTMRPFFTEFVEFARRQYPSLAPTLDEVVGRLESSADLEALLSSLNAAVEVRSGLPAAFDPALVEDWVQNTTRLRSHLLSYIVERCEQFDRNAAVEQCRQFIEGLTARRAVICSTNYDRIIEYVAEVAGIEVGDGFARGQAELVNPWIGDFDASLALVKIHGSVTWYVERGGEGDEFWRLDRGYPLPGPEFHLSRDGRQLEPLMIVPTLEKQALYAPYSYLLTYLGDSLTDARILVIIGSSLRDAHLVSLITYRRERLNVLVVGHSADSIIGRLPGVGAHAIKGSAGEFMTVSLSRLLELFESANSASDDQLRDEVAAFAERESEALVELTDLTETQRSALNTLSTGSEYAQLESLTELRSSKHPVVIAGIRDLLGSERPDVRSAAAGALGIAAAVEAIPELEVLSKSDPEPIVRLEAALALRTIGGEVAEEALSRRLDEMPDDHFVSAALASTPVG